MECIACGGTDNASHTLGNVSEAVDTAPTTDTASPQSEAETSEFGFTNSNDDERSLEEYKNDGIFETSFDYGQIPAITETEGYGDDETFDVLIKSLGVPSGYAVFNFINNDMTQSKSIFLAYEYEEYVLLFNIFDMNYYQYVGDETYRPDQVKSDVSYYTTEAWNKGNLVSELSEPSEESIRFDLVYSAGTLAK